MMIEPERLTGVQAREIIASLREREAVLAGEGGEAIFGEDGDTFYLVYPGFAYELPDEDEDLGTSALRFTDRESRNAYMREMSPMQVHEVRGWLVAPPGFSDSSALGVGGHLLAAAADWLRDLSENGSNCGDLTEFRLRDALVERLNNNLTVTPEVNVQGEEDRDGPIPGWNPGPVDLIAGCDEGNAWVELKWAKEAKTLKNCLWDAAKLAGAVRSKAASVGYMVAGAPASEWRRDHPYRNLFTFHAWEGGSIAGEQFKGKWDGWLDERKRTFPSELVDPIQILPFGLVRGGPDDWEIRVVRIVAPGNESIPVTDLGFSLAEGEAD